MYPSPPTHAPEIISAGLWRVDGTRDSWSSFCFISRWSQWINKLFLDRRVFNEFVISSQRDMSVTVTDIFFMCKLDLFSMMQCPAIAFTAAQMTEPMSLERELEKWSHYYLLWKNTWDAWILFFLYHTISSAHGISNKSCPCDKTVRFKGKIQHIGK